LFNNGGYTNPKEWSSATIKQIPGVSIPTEIHLPYIVVPVNRRRTRQHEGQKTKVKRQRTKEQTTINKSLHRELKISNTMPIKIEVVSFLN
jgi:inner membrane protein involved in colicin E2 resistance